MAIPVEQMKKILARSRELCTEDIKNSPAPQASANETYIDDYNFNNSQTDLDYSSPYGDLDESYGGENYQPSNYTGGQISQDAIKNSRLPEAIKQSMLNEQIDVSAADPNRSVLDEIVKQMPAKKKKPMATEQRIYTQPAPANIDYSLIKTIVEECIDRKLDTFLKQKLNESALKTIELNGGKIRLIDNKGNLFSAPLKHQGNINDKK